MERETGLEPATATLARWRSTTELFPPDIVYKIRMSPQKVKFFFAAKTVKSLCEGQNGIFVWRNKKRTSAGRFILSSPRYSLLLFPPSPRSKCGTGPRDKKDRGAEKLPLLLLVSSVPSDLLHRVFELFSCLELRHGGGRNLDGRAGLRIAPGPGCTIGGRKGPESHERNLIAFAQSICDAT